MDILQFIKDKIPNPLQKMTQGLYFFAASSAFVIVGYVTNHLYIMGIPQKAIAIVYKSFEESKYIAEKCTPKILKISEFMECVYKTHVPEVDEKKIIEIIQKSAPPETYTPKEQDQGENPLNLQDQQFKLKPNKNPYDEDKQNVNPESSLYPNDPDKKE